MPLRRFASDRSDRPTDLEALYRRTRPEHDCEPPLGLVLFSTRANRRVRDGPGD